MINWVWGKRNLGIHGEFGDVGNREGWVGLGGVCMERSGGAEQPGGALRGAGRARDLGHTLTRAGGAETGMG